jgi:CubicO group peptidase (beta-lactamase class C family)
MNAKTTKRLVSRSSRIAGVLLLLMYGCKTGAPPSTALQARAMQGALPFSPGHANPISKAKIDALSARLDDHFRGRLEQRKATGLAVGIVVDGEVVYSKGFGVRDVASGSPVDVDTVFRIASLSKSFTAAAVMKLRDEGTISLDAPITTYLPELSSVALPTRDSAPITVRQLLTHGSGLPWDDLWGAVSHGFNEQDLRALTQAGLSFSNPPGTRFEYSNLGYALLGRIVERVSGKGYREYVTANILRPLGMTSTFWAPDEVPPTRLAVGYRTEKDKLVPEVAPAPGVFSPAGGIYTSARDYGRYVSWQLSAYPPRDDAEMGPLRRSTIREMHLGQRAAREVGNDTEPLARRTDDGIDLSVRSYGLGWFNLTNCDDEWRVEHGGWEPGYFAGVVLLPQHGFGIFSMATTNGVGAIEGALALLREAGALPPARKPTPSQALVDAHHALNELLDRWDEKTVGQTFEPRSAHYPWYPQLRADLAKLSKDHGRCRPDGSLEADGRLHGRWKLACEHGAIAFDVWLTPAAKPLLDRVTWEEQFPPSEQLSRVASDLVQALNQANADGAREDLFEPSFRPAGRKKLQHLALDYSACSLEKPIKSDGRQSATYRLQCSASAVELSFNLNAESGRVVELNSNAPRAPGATCWP